MNPAGSLQQPAAVGSTSSPSPYRLLLNHLQQQLVAHGGATGPTHNNASVTNAPPNTVNPQQQQVASLQQLIQLKEALEKAQQQQQSQLQQQQLQQKLQEHLQQQVQEQLRQQLQQQLLQQIQHPQTMPAQQQHQTILAPQQQQPQLQPHTTVSLSSSAAPAEGVNSLRSDVDQLKKSMHRLETENKRLKERVEMLLNEKKRSSKDSSEED